MVSHCDAVNEVPGFEKHSTQHLLAGEIDCIVQHAIVEAELGDNYPPQVADVLLAFDRVTSK